MTHGDLILYATEDGKSKVCLKEIDGNVWLTQAQMAELFDVNRTAITKHVQNIYKDAELAEKATCSILEHMGDSDRRVYETAIYSLEMILAVGMRVRSLRGTQFRQWAIEHLKEYLIKGFVLDDDRLKGCGRYDYFDELLQRIRDIRASEQRFYQKVRQLFSLAYDYNEHKNEVDAFFATVQNKLLFAVTGNTAAEIIVGRSDATRPNMNLKSWSGSVVRKTDVYTAKNYLNENEVDDLNRLVTMFLDYAEMRTKERKEIRLNDWQAYVDKFVDFNEKPLLKTAGKISHERMKKVVNERYAEFDTARKEQAKIEADAQDAKEIAELEAVEKLIEKK